MVQNRSGVGSGAKPATRGRRRGRRWNGQFSRKLPYGVYLYKLGLVEEYRFAPPRKFRWDFAHIPLKIGIEVNGGLFVRGRHSRGLGYISDMHKRNLGTQLGWRILEFTPQEVQSGIARQQIEDLIKSLS